MLVTPDNYSLETDDLDALLREIIADWDAERSRQRRLTRREGVKSITILMLSGCGVGFAWKYLTFISPTLGLVVSFISGFVFLIGAACFLSNRESVSRLQAILTQMRGFNDVRSLPYELEAYEWFEGRDKANAASITSLFLKLKPSDASLMKPHLSKIVGFLTANRLREVNHDRWWLKMILAGLTALKNVGDSSAIPAVEKVAEMKVVTGNEARVVTFARDCLQTLQNRAEQQTTSQTLLRPANSQGEEGELLRAAASTEQNSNELLRIPIAK